MQNVKERSVSKSVHGTLTAQIVARLFDPVPMDTNGATVENAATTLQHSPTSNVSKKKLDNIVETICKITQTPSNIMLYLADCCNKLLFLYLWLLGKLLMTWYA